MSHVELRWEINRVWEIKGDSTGVENQKIAWIYDVKYCDFKNTWKLREGLYVYGFLVHFAL